MKAKEIEREISALSARGDLPDDAKQKLDNIREAIVTPLQKDVWIYRIVVIALGLIVLSTVIGGIIITIISTGQTAKSLPEGIVAIGSAAVGAMAGLLAPPPKGD